VLLKLVKFTAETALKTLNSKSNNMSRQSQDEYASAGSGVAIQARKGFY